MENTLRIYVFIACFHPLVGGAEKQCLAQCRNLRARGCDVTVVTFCHDSAWQRSEVVEGVPVIRIAGALLGRREKLPRLVQRVLYMLALFVLGWTLWRHRVRYDLVHLYNLGQLALPCALACRLTGKSLIIEVQGAGGGEKAETDSAGATLIAGPLDPSTPWLRVAGRARVGGDLESLERLGKPVVRATRALLRSLGAVVIVKSSRSRQYLIAHDFLLPGVKLIPNGVDIARFAPEDGHTVFTEKGQSVICVSRLSYEKGIDVLLQAWLLVHEQVPQARLIVVGDGPLRSQLEQLAAALGIAESIEFAGVQRDVAGQLHRAALAVLPSRIEGMPNALLEAMACGLACVATRVSGSEDLLQHGVNGLLVEPEDYSALAQALLVLLRDSTLAHEYGQRARLTVEQHYSQEHIADRYIELYESLAWQANTWKPLRVLMVTGIYPTERSPHSGTFIKALVESLIDRDIEVEIIHPKPGPAPLRYISAAAQVFLKTLTGRFDIVHGHYGQWCLLARMQWTTPVVASFLGSDLLGDVNLEGRLTWKGMLIPHVSRWLCQRVDLITVKSEEMKQAAACDNVIVYSDGIDFDLFRPIPRTQARAALGWKQNRCYILFGNNPRRAVKNYPLALAAVERLRARGVDAELVVASGLPQTTLVQYINACNAVILSSFSEGSPNIVKEAMGCCVPVVSTEVGDVRQLIGRTRGCSVCPPDPESLAAGLEQALLFDGPTTGRADIACLERSAVAQRVLAAYEQVIRERGKRAHGSFGKEQGHGESSQGTDAGRELTGSSGPSRLV